MGKARKPMDMQKGHIKVVDMQRRRVEEQQVKTERNQLKRPQSWLINDTAKREGRKVVKKLEQIDLIGNLDRNNLGGYCNAYANYIAATEELCGQEYCLERVTRTGTIIVKNPLVDVQKLYAEEMRRFAALCGLTIDSRLKAASVKTDQTQDRIKEKFGGI